MVFNFVQKKIEPVIKNKIKSKEIQIKNWKIKRSK